MAAESKTQIKTYFETLDKPTEAQFINLIDSYIDAVPPSWTTFVPTLKGSISDPVPTYNTQEGWYYRLGPFVLCLIDISWAAITVGNGALRVALPVNAAASPSANDVWHLTTVHRMQQIDWTSTNFTQGGVGITQPTQEFFFPVFGHQQGGQEQSATLVDPNGTMSWSSIYIAA